MFSILSSDLKIGGDLEQSVENKDYSRIFLFCEYYTHITCSLWESLSITIHMCFSTNTPVVDCTGLGNELKCQMKCLLSVCCHTSNVCNPTQVDWSMRTCCDRSNDQRVCDELRLKRDVVQSEHGLWIMMHNMSPLLSVGLLQYMSVTLPYPLFMYWTY